MSKYICATILGKFVDWDLGNDSVDAQRVQLDRGVIALLGRGSYVWSTSC